MGEPQLPPAIDLEFAGNCSKRPAVEEFTAELETFVEELRVVTGTKPVIYTVPDFYDAYLADADIDALRWIRSAFREPRGEPAWTFWQALPRRIAGASEPVDINAFRGGMDDLSSLMTTPG